MNFITDYPQDYYSTSVLTYTSIAKQAEETLQRERFQRDVRMSFQVAVTTLKVAGIICLLSLALASIV